MTKLRQQATNDNSIIMPQAYEAPWRDLNLNPDEINPVSSMIVPDESFYLHWLTREYYQGNGEIVDGGPLLGGSTLALASGLAQNANVQQKEKRIHSYDLFTYFTGFKDSILPESDLKEGDSLYPLFQENTKAYENYIQSTPGDILDSRWIGEPIEIFFIDLAKSWQINNHLIKEFFEYLIPNRSIVIQQDYFHYYCYWIHLTMQHLSPYFKIVHVPDGGSLGFILTHEIPKELLNIDYETYFRKKQSIQLMDEAIAPLQGPWKLLVMTAKIRLLADLKECELACSLAREIRASSDWEDWILYDVIQAENHLPAELIFPDQDQEEIIGVSRNYCLLHTSEEIYAIPHALGQLGKGDKQTSGYSHTIKAKTLVEIEQLIGETIHPLGFSLPPRLLDSYKGYNLVLYRNRLYAVPISLGQVNLAKEEDRSLPGLIVGEDLEQARSLIDLLGSYKGYDLTQYEGKFYAIPITLGHVDLAKAGFRKLPEVLSASSIQQVKDLIDETSFASPKLLETYQEHNLVSYWRQIYGIPISLGHVNLAKEEDRKLPGIIVADTIEEVKNSIDEGTPTLPQIRHSIDHNFAHSRSLPTLFRKALTSYRNGGITMLTHQTIKFFKKRFLN